jgi:hypothetical protein
LKIILLFICLGFLSFALTYFIRLFALKNKIVSIPNERSLHDIPTPHGGGLAIVISWYVGISILFFFSKIDKNLYFALLSGAILTHRRPERLETFYSSDLSFHHFNHCFRPFRRSSSTGYSRNSDELSLSGISSGNNWNGLVYKSFQFHGWG